MALLDEQASGVDVISATPSTAAGALDLPAIRHHQQPGSGLGRRKETLRRRGSASPA
jgi:hypothetical protein